MTEVSGKKNIIEVLCHRYKATLLFFFLCISYSIYGFFHIPRENYPEVKIPYISVFTILKGSSSEDVDRMITKPLERKLQGIQNVKKITSTSAFGYELTVVEFNTNADSETSLRKVKDKVDEVKPDLPKDIEEPVINEIDVSKFPVLYVMMHGNVSKKDLIKEARRLKKEIETIKQVLEVNITGESDDVIEIIPDIAKLRVLNITSDEVQRAIQTNNIIVPIGKLQNSVSEFNVKLSGLVTDVEHIKNLPIKRTKTGTIYLRDVANVVKSFKRPDRIARVNGVDAVVIEVSKRSGENIIETIDSVKKVINSNSKKINKDIKIDYSRDSSDQVKDAINDLVNSVILASLFVVAIIVLSIGKKQSLIIGLSIPFSFLMGIGSVYAMGYTLNIVVLFGFILGVGMIVDASTIVVEYADKLISTGVKVKEAYIRAAGRMATPVLSATIGIIVVYMPLLFWPGIMGKFLKYIPITIILVLSYSIIFAMLVVPVIGFCIEKTRLKNLSTKSNFDIFEKITPIYEKILNKILDNPKSYLKKIFVIFILSFFVYSFFGRGTKFFPDIEPKNINITVKANSNISLNKKIEIAKKLEDVVFKTIGKEVKIMYSKIGDPKENDTKTTSDTIIVVDIELINWQKRRMSEEIINDLKKATKDISGIKIEVAKDREGPNTSKPIELKILSQDFKNIDKYADDVLKYIRNDKQYKDIDDSRSSGKTEIVVEFDKNIASLYGITVYDLYYPLSSLTDGYTISTYRPNDVDDAVDINIIMPKEIRSIKEMQNLSVYSNMLNKNVNINNFTKFIPNVEKSFIKRTNGLYSVVLSANVADGVIVNNKIAELQQFIDENYKNNNEIKFSFGGDMEQQKETGSFLIMAFFVAICMKFLILVAQYNSVYYATLTMSAVFVAIGGVLYLLVLTFKPFCVAMGGMGIISIAGIVVSNNIVLIDTFQELINKYKMATREAVIKTALSRLRPVLITTTTTLAGLVPMMFNISFDFTNLSLVYNAPSGMWWEELATTICGGVLFALVLTLTCTPAMLMIYSPRDEEE